MRPGDIDLRDHEREEAFLDRFRELLAEVADRKPAIIEAMVRVGLRHHFSNAVGRCECGWRPPVHIVEPRPLEHWVAHHVMQDIYETVFERKP